MDAYGYVEIHWFGFVFLSSWLAVAQPVSAQRPVITGISHVTLYADDIPKSQQFYQSLLGWDMAPAGQASSGVRFYVNHLQYIELFSPPGPGPMDLLYSVGFSTSDAEALSRFLGAHGVSVPKAITTERDSSRSLDAAISIYKPNSAGRRQNSRRIYLRGAGAAVLGDHPDGSRKGRL
jgi:catechol 2,3-dioxygenase-like lactoylglutathione lyase family enzyme